MTIPIISAKGGRGCNVPPMPEMRPYFAGVNVVLMTMSIVIAFPCIFMV